MERHPRVRMHRSDCNTFLLTDRDGRELSFRQTGSPRVFGGPPCWLGGEQLPEAQVYYTTAGDTAVLCLEHGRQLRNRSS